MIAATDPQFGLWDLRLQRSREQMRDAVLDVLDFSPKSAGMIGKLTGLDATIVRQILWDLGADGLVVSGEYNRYARVNHA